MKLLIKILCAKTMKPQESITLGDEKWTNLSAVKCKHVYDILAKLEKVGALPEGKTIDDPSIKSGRDIMDYAERILENDQFWTSLPEEIPSELEGYTKKKGELQKQLSEIIEKSR